MTVDLAFFYLFAGMLILASLMVIVARHPVHAVLFLVFAFFNAAGLFVLLGAELLAMVLVIVYVGAVAVLFLFVVMMLDVKMADFGQLRRYLPLAGVLAVALLTELGVLLMRPSVREEGLALALPLAQFKDLSNTHIIGILLSTHYAFLMEVAGMILLVAMIGAIVLTLRERTGVRRQDMAEQAARRPEDVLELKKVPASERLS